MTRALYELLGHQGPSFQLHLRQLEQAAGLPSHDIRLTTDVLHGTQSKLRELGLDPHDTKGSELYAVLGARLQADEQRFAAALQANSPKADDPIAHVALALGRELAGRDCFAMKSTTARRLLKANIPKKTMKVLGYRSADSMLKHETVASLYAAAMLVENDQWLKKQLAAYSKLKGSDFEARKLAIEHPTSKRWQTLAETVVAQRRHNILSFKELGTVVLLPLPADKPELVTLTTAILALHACNEIYAASTFLKLHQVQPKFGEIVRQVAVEEPALAVSHLEQAISWQTVQRYYARLGELVRTDLFEPVLQMEDFVWHSAEEVLARIEPGLGFWQRTGPLALLQDGQVTSCNLTDQVLSHCNQRSFEQRVAQYFRDELRQELSLRYLDHARLEQALAGLFQKKLAVESVAA